MPRGLRVNNPGNIRKSLEKFQGEVLSPDDAFKAFSSLDYGYRAMSVIIYNYFNKHGLNSIRKIITRYAPPSDGNHTDAYINTVASRSGVSPDRVITEADFKYPTASPFMKTVIGEMARVEQGKAPDQTSLSKGYKLFLHDRLGIS